MEHRENFDRGIIPRKEPIYIAAAMRGRNPQNPSDRTAGIATEQRLEIKTDGVVNTLTSVQKDTLVLEVRFDD